MAVADARETWLENLRDEQDGVALYDGLAAIERDEGRAESFRRLAEAERRHAELWAKKLTGAGHAVPPPNPSSRTKLVLWLARRLGTRAVLSWVLESEGGDADKYNRQGGRDATRLADEERAHQEVLAEMKDGPAASGARATIARRERWHSSSRGGALRAAVFGVNDGVVSNLALVLGVAGAGAPSSAILMTGLAGWLAGASSMAVGEYVSVASQRDLLERQIAQERREIADAPEEEQAELAAIFEQKGLAPDNARQAAAEIFKDPEHALDTLVREELGLDPDDLGSPLAAAGSSFAMFSAGALLPLSPFLFTSGDGALVGSGVLAAIVLGAVGSFLGVLAGTGAFKSAARMILLAALAAAITFGAGHLIGANV